MQNIADMIKKDVIIDLAVEKQRLYSRYTVSHRNHHQKAATTAYKPPSRIPSSYVLVGPSFPWLTHASSACRSVFMH
jgi:hypothetical protein